MGNVIYWKEYDEPKKVIDYVTKKEYEITGEYASNDESIDKFWVIGCMLEAEPMKVQCVGNLLFKDGSRREFEIDTDKRMPEIKSVQEYFALAANNFIDDLKNNL